MKFKSFFGPMLLDEIENPFNSPDYLFELKFDGLRATIHVGPNTLIIYSRRGVNITHLYPELISIKSLVKENMIFDGEIVLFDKDKPNFSKLQERSHLKNKMKINHFSKENPVCFIAFDCIYKNKSLIDLTLLERKNILSKIEDSEYFIKTKYVLNNGKELFKKVKNKNLEGIVAKKIDSIYQINTRSKDWIKIKNLKVEEFYIGGYYNEPKQAMIRAYLGEFRNDNFYFVGKVMIGKKNNIYKKIILETIQTKSSFQDYEDSKIKYINPKLRCKIAYLERTKSNHLRQAVFKA